MRCSRKLLKNGKISTLFLNYNRSFHCRYGQITPLLSHKSTFNAHKSRLTPQNCLYYFSSDPKADSENSRNLQNESTENSNDSTENSDDSTHNSDDTSVNESETDETKPKSTKMKVKITYHKPTKPNKPDSNNDTSIIDDASNNSNDGNDDDNDSKNESKSKDTSNASSMFSIDNFIARESAHQEWKSKLSLAMDGNTFDIKLENISDIIQYWHYFCLNKAFNFSMNSSIANFMSRFFCYEEFVIGALNGFQFIADRLEHSDFESIEDCVKSDVFNDIQSVRKALLVDKKGKEYSLEKAQPMIVHVAVDREKIDFGRLMKNADETTNDDVKKAPFNLSVDIYFDVRYYCLLHSVDDEASKLQKYVDMKWHSKWKPAADDLIKYEMTEEWTVNHIAITNL